MGFGGKDRDGVVRDASSERRRRLGGRSLIAVVGSRRSVVRARRLIVDLSGRSGRETTLHVSRQVEVTVEGAELAQAMARGLQSTQDAVTLMEAIELRGDAERANLVHALGGALTTPIDREDLYRLSRSVDDVLDNLQDFVRECHLYQPSTQIDMVELLGAIGDGLKSMRLAVAAITRAPTEVAIHAQAARGHGNLVRSLYQTRLGELFNGPNVTTDVLKIRELLRRLDVVALRLGEAADALNDGMLKRSL